MSDEEKSLNEEFNPHDYIKDIRIYREKAFEEARILAKNNSDRFNHNSLVKDPQYKWLNEVECILKTPKFNSIEEQKKELNEFIEFLKKEAFYLETDHLPSLLPKEYKEPVLGFDTETTGLDTRTIFDLDGNIKPEVLLVGISLAVNENIGWYVPVRHEETETEKNWNIEAIKEFLSRLNKEFCLIIHNAYYDRQVIALNGAKDFREYPYFFDTQILYYLLNTDQNQYGLKHLSETILKRKMIDIWDLFKTDKSKNVDFIRFDFLKATDALVYACSDATNTFYLFKEICTNKSKTNPLLFQKKPVEIDHKLIDTLICMCRNGFPVDVHYSINALKDILLRVKLITKEIYKEAKKEFNIGSGKQLSELIFDELRIPPLEGMEKNKSGYYSVDEEALGSLQEKYPTIKFLNYVVMYRKLENSISKFYTKFIKNSYVDALTPYSRVQLSFAQTRTTTGRMASTSNGQLEQIKVKEMKITKKNLIPFEYVYVLSTGDAGYNSQGVPSIHYRLVEANELINIPEEVLELSKIYDQEIEKEFILTLTT